jgi:nitrogen-specific signal transduction histidine kinase/CheY-like chemotaxis protein
MFDDTRRKRLEDQLHQSQKMESIGTMASGIAHDFNNILNTVLGFAAQLQKHPYDPDKVLRYSQTIEKSALRGAELSARLLSFARVSRREDVPVDVTRIIDEVVALCAESFPRGVALERRVDGPLDSVKGDHAALYQVLLNLSVNARDAVVARHGTAGGSIVIQARNTTAGDDVSPELIGGPDLRCVEIRVTDNGIGIGPEIRERIFDPFFTTKDRGQGTGLGLSVVYTIVRNHRGTILVENAPGGGSVFRVLLPAMAPGVVPRTPRIARLPAPGRGELVLIVDDEESMIDLATELLHEQGYRVIGARSGPEAVRALESRAGEVRLAVLDLVMPGMDGEQTYRELKAREPSLKAVLCTGYLPGEMRSTFVSRENLRVVYKPFTPEALLSAVRETLDSPPAA